MFVLLFVVIVVVVVAVAAKHFKVGASTPPLCPQEELGPKK